MRHAKPKKVDIYRHPKPRQDVQIMIDEDRVFFATVHGKKYQHEQYKDLIKMLKDALNKDFNPEWQPLIHLEKEDPTFNIKDIQAGVGFSVERCYYARWGDKIFQCDWDDYHNNTIEEINSRAQPWTPDGFYHTDLTKFIPPIKDEDHIYLPYTETTWIGICNMIDAINNIKKYIDHIVDSKDAGIGIFQASVAGPFLLQPKAKGK